jgi:hypothetical protein
MSMLSRRNLLIGSAPSVVLATPFLTAALKSLEAQAAGEVPKRIVLFFTPHGTVWKNWRPTGTGGLTFNTILQPLEKFKSKTVVIDGVGLPKDGPGAPHTRGPAVLFSGSPLADDKTFSREDCSGGCNFGWNTGQSVDQEIARRLGNVTPYKSLEFGVRSGGSFPGSCISYQAPAKPNVPRQDPTVAFTQLFANQQLPQAQREKELRRRLDVLSTVNDDFKALQTTVSKADLERLNSHAEAISEIQKTLQATQTSCTPPAEPMGRSPGSPGFRPWAFDRNSEIIAASLACGLTRVASHMFRPGENDGGQEGIYEWLGHSIEHHLTTHDSSDAAQQRLTEIYRWYAERFAYLLEKLDSFKEGTGTLLDHTLVVWASEVGDGRVHEIENVPVVVAGGGLGGVKGGRSLKFPAGTLNHRLLVSMCHYMGYTDVTKFGTVDNGSGPLAGLLG